MFTIIASGLSIAGVGLLARKLSSSFRGVLALSEDLNPQRPMVSSGFKAMPQTGSAQTEQYAESMRRLSGVLAGSRPAHVESKSETNVAPEVPVA